MSQRQFLEGLQDDIIEHAMKALADDVHAKAASVVDPVTGKHATVFVRRTGKQTLGIHASGSPEFARVLEERLGLNKGEVKEMSAPGAMQRLVYLAHASEDKDIVKPLAEGLMQRGVPVWYDNWEIGYGDSLRRKMEEGLGECSHFVVLLTPTSIQKPWVNEEIDAGLMRSVEGSAKFIGLRYELPLDQVSPFLRTRLTPLYEPGDAGIEELAAQIFGISKKPSLGQKPRYVKEHQAGSSWSASARVVAEYFVRNSESAQPMDTQANYADIQEATSLPMPDVRLGVLDLVGAGLLDKQDYFGGESHISARADLFVTFDAEFMDWNPEVDARDLAVHLLNLDVDQVDSGEVAKALDWQPRRFNAAAAYLVSARIVEPIEYLNSDGYWPCGFLLDDKLLRFVRSM